MRNIVIVSKCLKIEASKYLENRYHFHFRGVYGGKVIRKIILECPSGFLIQEGSEYLLYVRVEKIWDKTLWGKIIKLKPLEECHDLS